MPFPTIFANLATGNQSAGLLDTMFTIVASFGVIPCTASGTNAIVLVPASNAPAVSSYTDLAPSFVFKAAATSTTSVNITVGSGPAWTAFKNNGSTAIAAGDVIAGNVYKATPLASLNGGNGGFVVDSVLASGAGSTGGIVSANFYAGSQTITIPANVTKAFCRMWGGSGGAGGSDGNQGSGGGGAAGYLEKLFTGWSAGNTLVWTQGALGAGGNNVPNNGSNGGNSTLASGTQVISTLTANGGGAGALGSTGGGAGAGGTGGTATGGDVNITGQAGSKGSNVTAGFGGTNLYAQGGAGVITAAGGNAGTAGGLYVMWFS